MKKTSRRKFAKQLTGALALPIVASMDVKGQEQRKTGLIQPRVLREHDTPPPVLVAEGSLTIETTHAFDRNAPTSSGRERRTVSAYSSLKLAHIKIVDGSGEMLYRNDKPPATCELRIRLSDASEVKFGQIAGGFYVDMGNDKDLGSAQNAAPHKREKRYRPKKGNDELVLDAITVAESDAASAPFLFKVTKIDLNSHLEESRVMIWLE